MSKYRISRLTTGQYQVHVQTAWEAWPFSGEKWELIGYPFNSLVEADQGIAYLKEPPIYREVSER